MTTMELHPTSQLAEQTRQAGTLRRLGTATLEMLKLGPAVIKLPEGVQQTTTPTFDRQRYSQQDWETKLTTEGYGGELLDGAVQFGD